MAGFFRPWCGWFLQAVLWLVSSGYGVAGFFRPWCGWFLQAVVWLVSSGRGVAGFFRPWWGWFLQAVVWLVSLSGKSKMLLASIKLLVSTRSNASLCMMSTVLFKTIMSIFE